MEKINSFEQLLADLMQKNGVNGKILFYTHTPRSFRTTLVGFLFQVAQHYPVILLSEKLDQETEAALANRTLFPKLEKIIPVNQFGPQTLGLFKKNRYLEKLAKQVIAQYRPSMVISESDMHSLFELYLMRHAKRSGAFTMSIQSTNVDDTKIVSRWVDYTNAYTRFPQYVPLWARLFLTKIRKYIGHFLYHWVLPIMAGELPFFGKSSYILGKGNSGMRDADLHLALSETFYGCYVKDGVPPERLRIVLHPLLVPQTRNFFQQCYFSHPTQIRNAKMVLVLMPGIKVGFKKTDWSFISEKNRKDTWKEIVETVSKTLPNSVVVVKPHPILLPADYENMFADLPNALIDTKNAIDQCIQQADIILGLPNCHSTVIFTAVMQCPGKPIAVLDYHREVMGDFYKGYDGVEYIEDKKTLISFLKTCQK